MHITKYILILFALFSIINPHFFGKLKGEVNVIINCEGTNLPFKNIEVNAPAIISRGNSIDFKVYGEADSQVEISKLKIQASINGNLVYTKTEDTPYANLSEGDGYDYSHTQSVLICSSW